VSEAQVRASHSDVHAYLALCRVYVDVHVVRGHLHVKVHERVCVLWQHLGVHRRQGLQQKAQTDSVAIVLPRPCTETRRGDTSGKHVLASTFFSDGQSTSRWLMNKMNTDFFREKLALDT
jgi:hypothetical protein